MVILTSSVNYSSHQRHLGSQPQGPVRGTDWDCKQRRGHRTDTGLQSWGELSLEHLTSMLLTWGQKNLKGIIINSEFIMTVTLRTHTRRTVRIPNWQ